MSVKALAVMSANNIIFLDGSPYPLVTHVLKREKPEMDEKKNYVIFIYL